MREEEAKAQEKADAAKAIKDECEADLAEVSCLAVLGMAALFLLAPHSSPLTDGMALLVPRQCTRVQPTCSVVTVRTVKMGGPLPCASSWVLTR